MEKIKQLDGLRAIAALIVVIHHYVLAFFPAMFSGNPSEMHLGNVETYLAGSPLGIFYAGNFAICIFFVISGFVLSYKFFKTFDRKVVLSAAIRRYFRLAIPIFATVFLAYLCMKFGFFFNKEVSQISFSSWWFAGQWGFETSFLHMLKSAFYGVFFTYDASYNTALWMMTYEFFGSFMVFGLLALTGKLKLRWIIYILAGAILLNTYYFGFILGMALSDIYANREIWLKKISKWYIALALLALGLFLGTYPFGKDVSLTVYKFLNWGIFANYGQLWHIVGAFFVIVSAFIWAPILNFLSRKIFTFLGNISFSVYLLHALVLGSFSSFLFLKLSPYLSYGPDFALTFLISIPIIFGAACLMYKYVDLSGIKFSQWIYEKIKNLKWLGTVK